MNDTIHNAAQVSEPAEENVSSAVHVSNLSSLEISNIHYRQTVERKKRTSYYIILFLMYVCVAIFAFLGTMWGFPMLILTLGTLFFAWYYKGVNTICYDYEINGYDFIIRRVSGLRQYTKNVLFVQLDLHDVIVVGAQCSEDINEAQKMFDAASKQRRVSYYTSAHDPSRPGIVMYARGKESEQGFIVRVYLQSNVHLINTLKKICPGKVYAYEE